MAKDTRTWTNKPEALILADVLKDEAVLDEIWEFFKENPLPRWQFHTSETPPFPPRHAPEGQISLQFYWDRGNTFVVHRDQDGLLWGVRIFSRDFKTLLWVHLRREPDEIHEPMGDNPYGGLAPGSRQSVIHGNAIWWALKGEVDYRSPVERQEVENQNAHQLPWDELMQEALEVYRLIYAPKFGAPI